MKNRRFITIALVVMLAMAMFTATLVFAQGGDADSQAEAARAEAAESKGLEEQEIQLLLEGDPYPLFIGVADPAIPTYLVDPTTNLSTTAFIGGDVWSAAYDDVNDRILWTSGTTLHEWPIGGVITTLGTIQDGGGNNLSVVGLAFYDGTLYGYTASQTEGIYSIDPSTQVGTLHIATIGADTDCGGLAADPNDGTFYCTNDDTSAPNGQGLYIVNGDGSLTFVVAYPAGETDIDGLTVSNDGFAYLVTDDDTPQEIYVYDLVNGAYAPSLVSPWPAGDQTFSAGAWIESQGLRLEKTVGTDPAVCATTTSISVEPGTEVTYCYEVTNSGDVTLTLHDLEDSELGTLLFGFPFTLTPGASVFVTESATIFTDTVNVATWAACNNSSTTCDDPNATDVVSDTATAEVLLNRASISLNKTVGTDPAVCAAADEIVVSAGTDVTYCYEVTNTGDVTLPLHDLDDSELGSLLLGFPFDLAPGASVFVTASANITQTTVNAATWTAYDNVQYSAQATDVATVIVSSPAPVVCNAGLVGFDAGIPPDWTVVNNAPGNPVEWANLATCEETGNWATGNGDVACASSDLQGGGSGLYDTELWTPPIDLTGYLTATVEYWANYGNFASVDFLDLDISTDGGATWTTLLSWNEDHHPNGLRSAPGEFVEVNLDAYVGQTVWLRWHYYDPTGPVTSQDWYAQVDEVGLACGGVGLGPSISLNKTVGTDPAVCAATSDILVPVGTDVTYCYEVTNTGDVTLTLHDLVDSELGPILSSFPYTLTPLSSVFVTQTANITQTTVNTATWTANPGGATDTASATVTTIDSAPFPTCVDFESGSLPSFMYAETTSSPPANGRVQVTGAFPYTGAFAMEIDTDCDGCGGSTLQSGTMVVDLAGESNVLLDFWVHEHGDENNAEDGVFISDDGGATWAQIFSLNGFPSNYENVVLDLAAAASGVGMNLVDGFQIRFQSFDNFMIPTDGYSFDDICVQPDVPHIELNKTVGTDPAVCAATNNIAVSPGTDVTYCYEVTNTGNFTLTTHDLVDSELGTILDGFSFGLTPGASAFLTQTTNITTDTMNVATWTACNVPVESGLGCSGPGATDVTTATASANVTVEYVPGIVVDQQTLDEKLLPDMQSTLPMTISNVGDPSSVLDWQILEEPAAPQFGDPVPLSPIESADVAPSSSPLLSPLGLGDELFRIDVGASTGSLVLLGVEYVNGFYYATAAGLASNTEPNYLFQLDDTGAVVNQWQQPTTSVWGWRDLAFDGTYLYGSDSTVVEEIDPNTGVATGNTIPCPLGVCRALAYDPVTDHFWSQDFGSNLYEFDRAGTVINTFAGTSSLAAYGAAWDVHTPGGPYLWIWSQDGPTNNQLVTATQVDPTTGNPTGTAFLGSVVGIGDNIAGGAGLSTEVVPGQLVMVTMHQADSDTIVAYDMDVVTGGVCDGAGDIQWASVNPSTGSTAAGSSDVVDVTFDSTGLPSGIYTGTLCIESNDPVNPVVRVPMQLEVEWPAIVMTKTVGTDPAVCATTDSITVVEGATVYYCYTVTNTGDMTLSLHDLDDDQLGNILNDFPYDLGLGASVFVTESATIAVDTTNTAVWTAFNVDGSTASYTDTATVTTRVPTDVSLSSFGSEANTTWIWLLVPLVMALVLVAIFQHMRRFRQE